MGVALRLGAHGVNAVGVPKTIDNDLSGTEVTFGFDTAVQIATDAIDRLRTTAESHHRVIVCEVMGRHVDGSPPTQGSPAGAAEILVPEVPFDVDDVCADGCNGATPAGSSRRSSSSPKVRSRCRARGRSARLATSGAPVDQFGHARLGGIGPGLAEELERRTGFEARTTILGHIQRGGTPSAFDRVLATRFGVAAVEAVHDGAFGQMVAAAGRRDRAGPHGGGRGRSKTVDLALYGDVAGVFLGLGGHGRRRSSSVACSGGTMLMRTPVPSLEARRGGELRPHVHVPVVGLGRAVGGGVEDDVVGDVAEALDQ